METSSLTPSIEKLIDMGFLRREVPITRNPNKTRATLCFITDNFIYFWLKYVLPYRSAIELGDTERVMNKIEEEFKTR